MCTCQPVGNAVLCVIEAQLFVTNFQRARIELDACRPFFAPVTFDGLHIRTLPVLSGDIPDVQICSSDVKAFE